MTLGVDCEKEYYYIECERMMRCFICVERGGGREKGSR